MIRVSGKSGIYAIILCDSISEKGVRILSYEISYPRIIHSELLTHGMLARNAASSRAIPFIKMREQLTAKPVRFGENVSGMQDKGDHNGTVILHTESGDQPIEFSKEDAWSKAKDSALEFSKAFSDAGYHKQVFNRLTEPFQMMKTVITGTEWGNFFWLRNHEDADPTLHELAKCMFEAKMQSSPLKLTSGEWHLPYVNIEHSSLDCGRSSYSIDGDGTLSLENAIKVSAARCAAVSFRNEDYGLEKCLEVYNRLLGADRKHASAFGHQATPITIRSWNNLDVNDPLYPHTWEPGVSHMDRNGQFWSAMLRGWLQYRKLVPGENHL